MNTDNQTTKSSSNQNHHKVTSQHTIDESQLGIFSKLVYRRVPQAIGFYLAGSWTFLAFFSSLISRFNYSPHWQDIALLIIVLLFPSILILAYRHGAPGIQDWNYIEKVGIPTNVLITLLIIYSQFINKDLGTSAEMVKGMGPEGWVIELERPKEEYRKRLAISFFNINDDTTDEYMALGIPLALKYDLEQDPYLNIFDPSDLAYEIKKSDFRGLSVPMALMLRIAKDNRIQYLLIGSLSKEKARTILETNLFNVEDGLLLKKFKTTDHDDMFSAVDDLSVQIRSAMGFSGGHINHIKDLPITEQLTNSMPAFLAFVISRHEERFRDNFNSSESKLRKALKLDKSFAAAASQYALLLFRQSRTDEGLKLLEKAKKHNYRLTDSVKFSLSAIESLFRANPDTAKDTVNHWIELYPEDATAWSMKYTLHRNFNERLLAIEALREIIKLEPFGTHRHLTIGEIYTSMGDIESALIEYEIFASKNPSNPRGHLLKGDSSRALGHLELAKKEYQQAKLLISNDLSADRRLSNLTLRDGKFQQAELEIKSYLNTARLAEENYTTWNDIASLYWLRGQRSDALKAYKKSLTYLKTYRPETSYLLSQVHLSWKFAAAGSREEAQQFIDDANMLVDGSTGNLYELNVKIAEALFDAQIGKTDEASKLIGEVSESASQYVGTGINDTISMFMGIIQFESANYLKAAESLEIFITKNPIDQNEIMALWGESLLRSGQLSEAKSAFEQILREFPSHPIANFGMARIKLDSENQSTAKPYLSKALKAWETADSSFEPAIEARKIFSQLESVQKI